MTERWLPIPGYEGLYEISDEGGVRSLDRILCNGHSRRGCEMTPQVHNNHGYLRLRIRLSKDGKRTYLGVGMLVLRAFVGPCPPGMECCHGDANPFNNHLSNLRWDTHSANMLDTVARGSHNMAGRLACANGHDLPPYIKGYSRVCLQCKEDRRNARSAAA